MSSDVATGRMMNNRDGPPFGIESWLYVWERLRFLLSWRLRSLGSTLRSRLAAGIAYFHLTAGLKFILSVGDYLFARRDAFCNGGKISHAYAWSHLAHVSGVIGFYYKHVSALRSALHRGRRYNRAVLANFQQQMDVHELVWPERPFRILE